MEGVTVKERQEREKFKLGFADRLRLLRGMRNPNYFKDAARKALYQKANGDPEEVHEAVLDDMNKHGATVKLASDILYPADDSGLSVRIMDKDIVPFGTSAGLDKNGHALLAFSGIFGFQMPGTVVLNYREGNKRPRVAVDEENLNMYNAQGFNHNGLKYFIERLDNYAFQMSNNSALRFMDLLKPSRHKFEESYPNTSVGNFKNTTMNYPPIYVSICGLPISEDNSIKKAMEEMEAILSALKGKVNGVEWNPASPNTKALELLRTTKVFHDTAKLMAEYMPKELKTLKMMPYEPSEIEEHLALARSFIDGGGNGFTATNTKTVPKSEIQSDWGFERGGKSGKFLRPYRLRIVRDLRLAFPGSIIIGTGGIFSGKDAYETFQAGANMVSGLTPYVYYGPGLLKKIKKEVSARLKRLDLDLQEMQSQMAQAAASGNLTPVS